MSTSFGNNLRVVTWTTSAILFLFSLLLAAESATAADFTWNRVGNNSWKNKANWLPNSSFPQAAGDNVTFNLDVATADATPALNQSIVISSITVNAAPSSTNFGLVINPGTPTTSVLSFSSPAGNAKYVEAPNALPGTGTATINSLVEFASNLDVQVQNQLTFANSISGAGGLTISGPGQVVLTSANTYGEQAGTTVNAGSRLAVTNTTGSATGTGPVVVHGTLGGAGIISGPVTFGGGTLEPGALGGVPSTLSLGSVSFADSSASAVFRLGTLSDIVNVQGNLTLDGSLNVLDAGGFGPGLYSLFTYTGALTDHGFTLGTTPAGFGYLLDLTQPGVVSLAVTAVPEPATWVMGVLGLAALVASARRKSRRHA